MNHKSLLFLLFLSLELFCKAQTGLISKAKPTQLLSSEYYYYSSFTVLYSEKHYFNSFHNQLTNIDLQEPIQAITAGVFVEWLTSYNYDYPGQWTLTYYIPYIITINDSLSSTFRGYEHHLSFAGQNIFNSKHFYFHLTEGISFGRIKLKNETIEKAKNAFLSPFAGIISGFKFSKLYINFSVSGNFDISSYKWKIKSYSDTESFNLNKFNHSGLLVSFGLGYEI